MYYFFNFIYSDLVFSNAVVVEDSIYCNGGCILRNRRLWNHHYCD
jgi:hypothetical protein